VVAEMNGVIKIQDSLHGVIETEIEIEAATDNGDNLINALLLNTSTAVT